MDSPDTFSDLLKKLASEHAHQVSTLRQRNEELVQQLLLTGQSLQKREIAKAEPDSRDHAEVASQRSKGVRFEEDADATRRTDESRLSVVSFASSVVITNPGADALNWGKSDGVRCTTNSYDSYASDPTPSDAGSSDSLPHRRDHPHVSAVTAAKAAEKGSLVVDTSPSSAQTIELHPVWADRRTSLPGFLESPSNRPKPHRAGASPDRKAAVLATAAMLHPRFLMHPNSLQRVLWDVLGMLLVSYDVVVIPLNAFELPSSVFIDAMTWVTASFWSGDIIASFLTGFHSDGSVVMNPRDIARHYMGTWLPFDILLCLVDWALLLAKVVQTTVAQGESSVGYARVAARAARFLRVLRLLRLVKLQGVLNEAMERIQSEFWVIMVGVVRLVIFILVLNHMIACVWYWMGTWTLEHHDSSWVEANSIEGESLAHRYGVALHWSLTQFTPASMEVVPINAMERYFTICTVLFAMVAFSSFISSITQAMTRLRSLNREWNDQQAALRRYMCENQITTELMGRIWGCLDQIMSRSKHRTHEKDVQILALLPWTLRVDLQAEVYDPIMDVHPCFANFIDHCPDRLWRVYQHALHEVSLNSGHELFHAGAKGDKMYFIVSGLLTYNRQVVAHSTEELTARDWVSEAAIWVKWQHCGQLLSSSHCELVALQAAKVHEEIGDCEPAAHYARLFCEHLQRSQENLTDVIHGKVLGEMADKAFSQEGHQSFRSHSSKHSSHTVASHFKHWSGWSSQPRRRRTRQFPS